MKILDILAQAKAQLSQSSTPQLDAEVLLAHVLNVSREHLRAWPDKEITKKQQTRFNELIKQRKDGYPIAYLTGEKEFWSLPFNVAPGVLIPRPETELLVETILNLFSNNKTISLLDLGTGSGIIALALAHERPNWQITATDISKQTLQIAEDNADQLNVSSVNFILSDWFDAFSEQQFDIIVSNPPYIAENDEHLKQGDVRFEPKQALVSGEDGLEAIQLITKQAQQFLKPQGSLFIEHGYDQAAKIQQILTTNGYKPIHTLKDLAGLDRVTYACYIPV